MTNSYIIHIMLLDVIQSYKNEKLHQCAASYVFYYPKFKVFLTLASLMTKVKT